MVVSALQRVALSDDYTAISVPLIIIVPIVLALWLARDCHDCTCSDGNTTMTGGEKVGRHRASHCLFVSPPPLVV